MQCSKVKANKMTAGASPQTKAVELMVLTISKVNRFATVPCFVMSDTPPHV